MSPLFPGGKERARYTNKPNAAARTTAQWLLLKPAIWKLVDVNIHGLEHLDDLDGAFVVFGNHSSHLDAPLIYGSLPSRLARYLAAGAAADYFFDSWWKAIPTALFLNAFPVERKGARTRKGMAGNLLSDGVPLLLFPEGTRSRTGAMGPFKPGAAALCISRNVPAVPVALVGAYAAWPHRQSGPPRNRPRVHVVYGQPMMPHPGEIAHEFNERMRRKVLDLHDQTAQAYGMRTLAEYARTVAIEAARPAVDDAES